MPFDIDQTMLVYLGMITAGIFLFPIESSPPYYLVIGIGLIVVGGILVLRKSRKKELGTKL
ncbi:MAG: LPXTG cell wall anchor domain-containing protein [Nitrosotalea sp.]|jgi:LPXTG-motif cell wall-anchored protein